MDKANVTYWDDIWSQNTVIPPIVDVNSPKPNDYIAVEFHKLFISVLGQKRGSDTKILEVGCGNSVWLPYFGKYYGFDLYGMDYSQTGCQLEEKILQHYGQKGTIICENLFMPPERFKNNFDIIISMGVVEHFDNTNEVISALVHMLKPGGTLITTIPNLVGLNGTLQKLLDKSVYDVHVPISREALKKSHEEAGLVIKKCNYFLFMNLLMINYKKTFFKKNIIEKFFIVANKLYTCLGSRGINFPVNKFTSPYVFCIGQKSDIKDKIVKVES